MLKVRNPQFLKRPWLFTVYTTIGGALPIYIGRPVTYYPGTIAIAIVVVVGINIWFYVALKRTLNER